MDIKTKIETLTLAADAKFLGFFTQVPKEAASLKLLESTVQKYAPALEDRVLFFSWAYAYRRWCETNPENSKSGIEYFQNLCMHPKHHHLYAQAFNELAEKLPKSITVEYLKQVAST